MPEAEEIRIEVPHDGIPHVSGLLDRPDGDPRAILVLAHGSGAPMTSAFMARVAPALAARTGAAVMRFQYAYMERMSLSGTRRPPERRPALESVHRAAFEFARKRFPGLPLLGGGKSLGGRISTLMAADGEALDGLLLLGYPLHPPGKPEKQRTEHFPNLKTPTLFLQGTRDALCDLELLDPALKTIAGNATLHVVEGADHGFDVLKRSGRTPDEVLDEICAAASGWIDGLGLAPAAADAED